MYKEEEVEEYVDMGGLFGEDDDYGCELAPQSKAPLAACAPYAAP